MKEITSLSEFQDIINSEEVSIVKFGADWCKPCEQLDPILDEIEREANVVIHRVDSDTLCQPCIDLEINMIPAIIFFRAGKIQRHFQGLRSKKEYMDYIQKERANG